MPYPHAASRLWRGQTGYTILFFGIFADSADPKLILKTPEISGGYIVFIRSLFGCPDLTPEHPPVRRRVYRSRYCVTPAIPNSEISIGSPFTVKIISPNLGSPIYERRFAGLTESEPEPTV